MIQINEEARNSGQIHAIESSEETFKMFTEQFFVTVDIGAIVLFALVLAFQSRITMKNS